MWKQKEKIFHMLFLKKQETSETYGHTDVNVQMQLIAM